MKGERDMEGKTAEEIEALRVIDPACGSAHFLVEAMRFMGRELHRAYVEHFEGKRPPAFTRGRWDTDWKASDEEARAANSEARAWSKRRIAERCLFGVDLNPTAVNLARVALWIESLAGDRPLTYFDHHVRCGNSLLGTWLDRLDDPPLPKMEKGARGPQMGLFRQADLFSGKVREMIHEAGQTRLLIDRAGDVGAVDPDSLAEQQFKHRQHEKAEKLLSAARLLFDLRSASAFVPAIWDDWHLLCGRISDFAEMQAYGKGRKWWSEFEAVRQRERFFHWELEYPEIFSTSEKPGLDAVIGNPPWDKVLPTKHEFYARYDILIRAYKGNDLEKRIRELHKAQPDLAQTFKDYRERTRIIARILRTGGDFPLSKARSQAAHEDVSKYFVDRAARIAAKRRNVGMIVPAVLYNGDGCVGIRRFLLEKASIRRFYAFENRKKIFPIHPSYKFVSLVFCKEVNKSESFKAAFMRQDVEELSVPGNKPWIVHIQREEIRRLSPLTYAFLEYRNPRDQQIVSKMYQGKPTLGGTEIGNWGATFISWRAHTSIFNSSEDKDLWSEPGKKRLFSPKNILDVAPSDLGLLIEAMRTKGFWPVFEGKSIEQFIVGPKGIRWWLSIEQAELKYAQKPEGRGNIVFRDVASNTNERTCITTVLPDFSVGAHTLSGLTVEHVKPDAAAVVLNSFCFDFAIRLRTAGTHLSFTYMRPMPVPDADTTNALTTISTQPSWASNADHISEISELWSTIWQSNRDVAESYGLSADDFEHILDSFPVFSRKRPEFFAYLKERLIEWKKDTGEKTGVVQVYPAAGDQQNSLKAAEPSTNYQKRDNSTKE